MYKLMMAVLCLVLTPTILTGCANDFYSTSAKVLDKTETFITSIIPTRHQTPPAEPVKPSIAKAHAQEAPIPDKPKKSEPVRNDYTVLVNKQFALAKKVDPSDLVEPNIPFIFQGESEKRLMRPEAAAALEKLFAGAAKDGVKLSGVSAYRSYETQEVLFDNYTKRDGLKKAKMYSAVPGYSEHETGLAIDVTGIDGKCAASDCFAGTKEADWLDKHAWEYGYIIRYPKGKESITGYQYEPWHIRYVGTEPAREIHAKGITLEEYLGAIPAMKTVKKSN